MKKIKLIQILTIALVSVLYYSCVKQDFKDLPQIVPNEQLTANLTIENLLKFHTILLKNKLDSIEGDTIIQGVVTGNDESGNIYKQMFIQDGTAGIVINVDMADYYNEYKIGQKVFIKCKGLVLGDYSGLKQLGLPFIDKPWGPWKVGRIPAIYIKKYIFKDGLPNDTLKPKKIGTFLQLTTADIGKLVTFENVSFPESGQAYTEKYYTTDRNLFDSIGGNILIRTSNYSNFATDLLPGGVGKITGILSYYASGNRSVYQLLIRNKKEVESFVPTINFAETFVSSLGSFTQYSVTGAQFWYASSHSGKTYANMTGYDAGPPQTWNANEDWLISKPYDFSKFAVKKFSFESAMNYGLTNDGTLKVYYSTNYSGSGNPNSSTWTEMSGYSLSPGTWTWTPSGEIDLSAINDTKVFVAFKYLCTSANVPTWEITSIKLKGSSAK